MQSIGSDQALLGRASDPGVTELALTELYAWGVDFSSYDVHVGAIPDDRNSALSWSAAGAPPGSELPTRFGALYRATQRLVNSVAHKHPPLAVAIEEPNRSREVIMAHGVIAAALSNGLWAKFRHPVSIWTVNTTTWRRTVLREPLDPAHNLKQQAIAHVAETFGYITADHNHADAICIADWLDLALKEAP